MYFKIYLPVVNRLDLFARATESLGRFVADTIVIDRTEAGIDGIGCEIVPWQGERKFTQVMNWIQRDAYRRNLDCFVFMHSDAETIPEGICRLLAEAERLAAKEGDPWGVIFTHYDAIALFNPVATRDVGPWDESFLWYVSDIDYYNRLKWAGWAQHNLPGVCTVHHGSQTLYGMTETERNRVKHDLNWAKLHYAHKWGCHWDVGNGRKWTVPYGGERESVAG